MPLSEYFTLMILAILGNDTIDSQIEFSDVWNDLKVFLKEIADNMIIEMDVDKKWDPRDFKWK